MTARLDVTAKTTQNRIELYELVNLKSKYRIIKRLRSRYCTIEAMTLTTDIYEASRGLFATVELLVFS